MKQILFAAFIFIIAISQVCLASTVAGNKVITTVDEIAAIPREDSPNDKEVVNFEKNWKGKTISITGKVNKGRGVSIGEYYVDGCSAVLKAEKVGTTVTVTGVLSSRYSGGSGGEPVELSNCRLGSVTESKATMIDSFPVEYRGLWDESKQKCKEPDNDTSISIGAKNTYQLENPCDLKSIIKAADQSITAKMQCSDELQQSSKATYNLRLLPDGRLMIGKSTLVRCK